MRAPLISASRQGLAKENQRKESEQNSRNSAKQTKAFLNFWKGFIRHCTNADPKAPAHIPVVNLILGAKCLR